MSDLIRNAVIHLMNEQPLLADLLAMPTGRDTVLICTNLRTTTGKRPVFIDDIHSVFVFPIDHVRFVEVPSGAVSLPSVAASPEDRGAAEPAPEPEADLEIDEEFLRRIRDA